MRIKKKQIKKYSTGTVQITSKRKAYLVNEQEKIRIPFQNLQTALNGDTVKAFIYRKNARKRADVVEVLQRYKTNFVGVLQMHKTYAFLISDDNILYTDIYLSKRDLKGAKNGDKVVVTLKKWKKNVRNPYGKVIKVIGKSGTHQTEMHSILETYELPYEFSERTLSEASKINVIISEKEIAKRKDFRDVVTFTIDPKDAKDFDDALSFEILENGNYKVGVHIADVSHYVAENSALDKEAYQRGTSIYLVDRVVPMLPEILSNEVCSLNAHQDKLTFSAVFEIDENVNILSQWFGKTIINSDKRFTYEEAQMLIKNKNSNTDNKQTFAILKLNELAEKMRKIRLKNGAISFEKTEIKFQLDERKNPVSVFFKISQEAHKLIEEWMLLANKKVAEFVGRKLKKTFVYRVHDSPDIEKLIDLKSFVRNFGYHLEITSGKSMCKNVNKLLKDVQGAPEENIIETLTIRCMSKASYATGNIGHYGLAFDYYTHFTSPIRRYPDMMVHRLLQRYLDERKSASVDLYQDKCKHSSKMEILAIKAERDSVKYMQVKYMQNQKNKVFEAMISGVTSWGIYVEIIENKCEGVVRIKDMQKDYYVFDSVNYTLKGYHYKQVYRMGDKVFIKVKKADLEKKYLDFYLVNETLGEV